MTNFNVPPARFTALADSIVNRETLTANTALRALLALYLLAGRVSDASSLQQDVLSDWHDKSLRDEFEGWGNLTKPRSSPTDLPTIPTPSPKLRAYVADVDLEGSVVRDLNVSLIEGTVRLG